MTTSRKPAALNRRSPLSGGSGEWERGYFCAVAALIRMNDGLADTTAIDLFKAGGKPDRADECDKALFHEAGLLPNVQVDLPPKKGGYSTSDVTGG